MTTWLLLIYKVPNEPSARRVYVWRKLKALGALLLQDSAWVLPATAVTREKLQWLAAEIREIDGGFASLWEAREVFTGQESDLIRQFTEQAAEAYGDILARLRHDDADLSALSKQYQQIAARDYFQAEVGRQVRDALRRKGEINP